jgi:Zn-dependent peptidase ImmA (M78 family)
MHIGRQTGDRITETEANRFAGAFLMPRSTFSKEFPTPRSGRMSWRSLSELKLRWKVSKAAMIYRARQLGLLSEDQHRSGVIFLTRHGEARVEDEDSQIAMEKPELFDNAVRCTCDHYSMSLADLGKEIGVRESIIQEFLGDIAPRGGTDHGGTVVDIARYRARLRGLDEENSSERSAGST